MERLIADLVDVVSIDAGKLALEPTPSDAVALLAETVEACALAAPEKGISLGAETSNQHSWPASTASGCCKCSTT